MPRSCSNGWKREAPMPGLMEGKRGLVMGVANDHSIAWGIAKMLSDHGAKLAFTYQGDALAKRVALISERELGAVVAQHLGDAPGDRVVVGDPHHQPTFALHQSRHRRFTLPAV